MNRVNLAAAVLAGVATTLTLSSAAQAQVVVEGRPTIRVSYADLDVASKTGLATLNGRVRAAATQLCGANSINLLKERAAAEQCRDDAIAGAKPQIELAAGSAGSGTAVAAAAQGASQIAVSLR